MKQIKMVIFVIKLFGFMLKRLLKKNSQLKAKIKELESHIYTDQNKEIWRKHET